MRVHPCLYENMHRDGILKEGQCRCMVTFDYVNSDFKPAIIISKLLPSIWDKRRAYKKVIDFLHMKETNIATKKNRIGYFD